MKDWKTMFRSLKTNRTLGHRSLVTDNAVLVARPKHARDGSLVVRRAPVVNRCGGLSQVVDDCDGVSTAAVPGGRDATTDGSLVASTPKHVGRCVFPVEPKAAPGSCSSANAGRPSNINETQSPSALLAWGVGDEGRHGSPFQAGAGVRLAAGFGEPHRPASSLRSDEISR